MGTLSKIFYSIANFFTWIIVIVCVAGLVFFPLMLLGVIANNTGYNSGALLGSTIYLAIALLFALLSIAMVRRAKANGTSKLWDLLFIIIGLLSGNIFYFLGGLFGLFSLR